MPSTRTRVPGLLLCAFLLVTACSGGGSLPAGQELLRRSATAMQGVQSIGFVIRSTGNPPISVKSADGRLLRSGDAEGTIQLTQSGQPVEMAFTMVGDTVYFKGATGRYQRLPKAAVLAVYDPSAILDPQRGVVKLLNSAKRPETEERERVGGQDALRVQATWSKSVVSALVPGVASDVDGQVWIAATGHRLLQTRIPVPKQGGGTQGAVTVTFSDFNARFTITAPPAGAGG
jgi:lipoprotein LprG